jgi:hypothetical protein
LGANAADLPFANWANLVKSRDAVYLFKKLVCFHRLPPRFKFIAIILFVKFVIVTKIMADKRPNSPARWKGWKGQPREAARRF